MPAPIPDLSRDQQCHHYQAPSGHRCGSPAMKGEYYCYHHLVKTNYRKNHRVLIDPEITRMELPPIEDRASIFIALAAVVHRLAENTIDTRRAGQMIYALQVAMRALEPPRVAPSNKNGHSERAQRVEEPRGTAPAKTADTTPPPDQPTPKTIPITKESLLYFLRSRHCASCNSELFPVEELTERANPGAPPEVIEEARPALPAPQPATDDLPPATVLPTLQAVAETRRPISARPALSAHNLQPATDNPLRSRIVMSRKRPAIRTHAPGLLYTHLGARYPRDLRVQSGASPLQTAPPASIFLTRRENRRTKWQQ
jgi:hypothetical protein